MGYLHMKGQCWCRHLGTELVCLQGAGGAAPEPAYSAEEAPATSLLREPTAKAETAAQLVRDHISAGRKVLVFSCADAGSRRLRDMVGVGKVLSGAMPQKHRILNDFQRGDLQALFLTSASGGVGVDLHAASAIVFADRCLFKAERTQCVGRVLRVGQAAKTVYIDDVFALGTFEANLPFSSGTYRWDHTFFEL